MFLVATGQENLVSFLIDLHFNNDLGLLFNYVSVGLSSRGAKGGQEGANAPQNYFLPPILPP